MDRRFLFNVREIRDSITKNCVPFAGEEKFLRDKMAPEWGKRLETTRMQLLKVQGENLQGNYIATPDGECLGFWNGRHRAPTGMSEYLKRMGDGLARFEARRRTAFPRTAIGATGWPTPPEGAIFVATAYSRALTRPSHDYKGELGTSQLWIFPKDVQQILSLSQTLDKPFELPKALCYGIAKSNLYENIRAGAQGWPEEQLRAFTLTGRATRNELGARTVEFVGRVSLRNPAGLSGEIGLEGVLHGRLILDVMRYRVLNFQAYADAEAWGDARWHAGPPQPNKFKVGIAFVETTDEVRKCAPPTVTERGS